MKTDNNFFDKRFWQGLLIATFSQLITLTVAVGVSFYINGTLEKMTDFLDSLTSTVESIESIATNVSPNAINERAEALQQSAAEIGEGVGDGGAETVNRIGNALRNFRNQDEIND